MVFKTGKLINIEFFRCLIHLIIISRFNLIYIYIYIYIYIVYSGIQLLIFPIFLNEHNFLTNKDIKACLVPF